MKKLLFVSVVNQSLNPRVLKEITLAVSLGYEVSFVGFNMGNWSDETEAEIKRGLPGVKYHYLDSGRQDFGRWFRDSLLEKGYKLADRLFPGHLSIAARAHTKRTIALLRWVSAEKDQGYDLVIAHTLGALYPAAKLAARDNSPFAFDVEDYHPGEHIATNPIMEKNRRERLMRSLLPDAAYITAASPLIAEKVMDLSASDRPVSVYPILNYFPKDEFIPPLPREGKIRLIWFSQSISEGRGLELLLPLWDRIKDRFSLTLVGKPSPSFLEAHLKEVMGEIRIVEPLPQRSLHRLLADHDVGLALDLTSRDLNRDLALTNKILAYFQAGLYILATDTSAQTDFLDRHPGHGKRTRQDSISIMERLEEIATDIHHIRQSAEKRFNEAKAYCWEKEAENLVGFWEQTFIK